MAVITSSVVAGVGALGGAAMASRGAKDAARTQQRGYDAATAEQRRQYEESMRLTAPRREVEGNALNLLAQMTGVRPAGGGNSGPIDPNTGQPMGAQVGPNGGPDWSAFFDSPDYQFALEQGEQSAMRGASSMGNLRSGNTLAALTRYGQGAATQNVNNYMARLTSLAGMGADQSGANMAMQQGSNVANNLIGGANARASGVAGATNAWGGALNQLGQMGGFALQQWGARPARSSPTMNNAGYQTPPFNPYGTNAMYRGGYNA